MTTGDWLSVIGLCFAMISGAWFVIMIAVDKKIADLDKRHADALNSLKLDAQNTRIKELERERDDERYKNDVLKDKLKDYKN